MKHLFLLTTLAVLTSACATPQPKPCDNSRFSAFANPCGPEIEINTHWRF